MEQGKPGDDENTALIWLIGRYLILALLAFWPVLALWLDVHWLGNTVGEASITEVSQSLFLIVMVLCFGCVTAYNAEERGFAVLAAGLFLAMLIREQNNFLKAIHSGLWEVLVTIVAVIAVVLAWRSDRVVRPMLRFLRSPTGAIMVVGLILLLFFSRTMGMGALWDEILKAGYVRVAKNAVEEGTESMAYVIMLYASVAYACARLPLLGKRALFEVSASAEPTNR